jgi:serine O-acetyltransferase
MQGDLIVRAMRRGLVLPLILLCRLAPCRAALQRDMRRFNHHRLDVPLPEELTLVAQLDALAARSFRSLLYCRLGNCGTAWRLLEVVIKLIWPGETTFYMTCSNIGSGLYISHGVATLVGATSIGIDCLISQQVTIGFSDKGGPPTLGDRVRVGAGALILGPITIGDDAVVGAGAVVVKDVPAGAVVAGVPAREVAHAANAFASKQEPAAG